MTSTICCIGDCHLGYRHRLKAERLRDYERAFYDAVGKAMNMNPGLMIFSGDLLHHTRPDPKSMRTLIKTMMEIADSLPVVVCVGNHEIDGHLGTAYAPLFSDLHENIHVLTTETPHVSLEIGGKKIGIHGFEYIRNRELAEKVLADVTKDVEENDFNILCLHQGIEKYIDPFEISSRALRQAAERYDLIVSGHVHKNQNIREVFDVTPAYYIGSTERISFNESKNINGFMAFRNFDFENPEFVEVNSSPMKSVREELGKKTAKEINEHIASIIDDVKGRVNCLQVKVEAEMEDEYLGIRQDWKTSYPDFTILDVSVMPKISEAEIKFERQEISGRTIEEYFEKSGMEKNEQLMALCLELYGKYAK